MKNWGLYIIAWGILIQNVNAQENWTWQAGSDIVEDYYPRSDEIGITDPRFTPPKASRKITWIDDKGNLMFMGSPGINDVWRFNGEDWTWIRTGEDSQFGNFGEKGIESPENNPSRRTEFTSWVDDNGSIWVFGGFGYGGARQGYLNDLWKFDGETWVWVHGYIATDIRSLHSGLNNHDINNIPGARVESMSWVQDGELWLFGGKGIDENGDERLLNDLWKFDGNSWAWMGGSLTGNSQGNLQTRGTPHENNIPGARYRSLYTYNNGVLWLYGGSGYAVSYHRKGLLSDLWKFEDGLWTFISGSEFPDQDPFYDELNIPSPNNSPGGRELGAIWVGINDDLLLFGGKMTSGANSDIWRFESQEWAAIKVPGGSYPVYGTRGVYGENNYPDKAVDFSIWITDSNEFIFYGGKYTQNELWSWDGDRWAWLKGKVKIGQPGMYLGDELSPGGREGSATWLDKNNNLWVYGGFGIGAKPEHIGKLSDLWKYSSNEWELMDGNGETYKSRVVKVIGNYHPENHPGERYRASTWLDDEGILWLFGGQDNNDLWKFNGNDWAVISVGDTPANYGQKGIAGPTNIPGARDRAVSWMDNDGTFWLFGGYGYDENNESGRLNDLWKYSDNQWTWISGSKLKNQNSHYGNQRVPAESNTPGARTGSSSWVDKNGELWLFGGYGYVSNGLTMLNELWKFDGSFWAWISGSNNLNSEHTELQSIPGKRRNSASWYDTDGNVWIMGGEKFMDHRGNDLWRYNRNWKFEQGDKERDGNDKMGIYGTKGIEEKGNYPGSRSNAIAHIDSNGYAWIFGGRGFDATERNDNYLLNDLWSFKVTITEDSEIITGSIVQKENHIHVYPNPFENHFSINLETSKNRKFSLTDIHGKLILYFESDRNEVFLDISQHPAGIYLLKILSDSENKTIRINKN